MTFMCPKCSRYGMEWDGRAKALVCYYSTCNQVIPLKNGRPIPTPGEIENVIRDAQRHMREVDVEQVSV